MTKEEQLRENFMFCLHHTPIALFIATKMTFFSAKCIDIDDICSSDTKFIQQW